MAKIIDLHMHSFFSNDGEFTPEALVDMCKEQSVTVMSLSDHNCAQGNARAQKAAEAAGITYIPGIEIDCTFDDVEFHVLGYGIDYRHGGFDEIENNIARQSEEASYKMLEATKQMGFAVAEADLLALEAQMYWKKRWTGEMFGEILLNKEEYRDHPMLAPYRAGGERSQNPYVNFYWDHYSQGKPGYVKMEYPDWNYAIDIIHQNGGKAVLAHPGVNLKGRESLFEKLAVTGIDGVEAFSSYHNPKPAGEYYDKAKAAGLFITCGSDFHGKTKPAISLGQHGGEQYEMELQDTLQLLL